MRGHFLFLALALGGPFVAGAQTPQQKDSIAKADSTARADSIALVRELEQQAADTTGGRVGQQGSSNPRLLPDISVVGDLIADFSPKGSTQEGGERFSVRELELAFQAAVDPYFRADVFVGLSDEEGAAIEQAFLTTTALPAQLEARLGRFLMPVGKQITTHRHDLHTIEFPYVIQRFYGPEGLKGTGVYLSRVFSPLGFYQEIIGTAVDRFGEAPEDLTADDSPNRKLSGLGFSARLRNYWDLSEASNLELSFSGVTGKRERALPAMTFDEINAQVVRQSVIGADVTYRWRPLQQGLYKSFILQAEVMQQRNERGESVLVPDVEGNPTPFVLSGADHAGGYAFARYQTSRRSFLAGRYDFVDDPDRDGANTRAASAYLEIFPSEFSKLMAGYERYMPGGGEKSINRLIFQATFALGPHKPHPF